MRWRSERCGATRKRCRLLPDQRVRLAKVLIWLTPALWAVNSIVARKAPGVVDPHVLALGRWALAGAILGWIARHELWQHRKDIWAVWPQYLTLGACGMLICGAWLYVAAHTTGVMNIALIYAAAPVLISVGAVLWLGERMTVLQGMGVGIAIVGVLHVVTKGEWSALARVEWVVGDLLMVAAATAWAAYALLQKKWTTTLGSTARLACICMGGMVCLLPFAVWESVQPQAPAWSTNATLLVIAAGIIPGIGAYGIYGWAQKVLGASRVSVTLYLGPLWGALSAWGVMGEPLGWHHLVGALLILPGVALVTQFRQN